MTEDEKRQIEGFEEQIGAIRVNALKKGGERLLNQVDPALGVASRHIERVRTHVFGLSDAVQREIRQSLERASAIISRSE